MESLAYIHAAVDYEDPNPVPEVRSIDEITSAIPSSALMGVAGAAIAVGVLTHAPDADAALRRGNVCSAVSTLQSTLQRKGYSVGRVDGAFGNNTEFAVKQFQAKNGLSRDGIVGPATASTMGLNSNISCGSGGGGIGGGGGASVIAGNGVKFRSGPGLGYRQIGGAGYGERVAITSQRASSDGYRWAKLSGQSGWVATAGLDAN